MAASATLSINEGTLTLSGVLDYESVLDVDAQGREWLKSSAGPVCNLDLASVTYSSSAGIALLLGWLRVAQQQQKTLRIQQMPANMAALAKVGGLEDVFA